ncbi:MAG: Fic family protein [Gammaproteobacteria bacterium]|nr:Fic family protein [Gammaproteobacteria bacterium]MDE0273647.1 Fic family protein [Gammaproteobacteria bacterium]
MWVWQHPDWPNFIFDPSAFPERVEAFHRAAERLSGRFEALSGAYQTDAQVALMLSEVIATSAIEGENLDRDSVRSSLLRHFGQVVSGHQHDDRAVGATELIVDVRRNWHLPLSHETLGQWQSLVVVHRITSTIMRGAYRNHPEPMQIVSGRYVGRPRTVHYEAPPSAAVPVEMERFLDWYNGESGNPPGPVRAAVAHVWFEKIHPFEDGNGRVGRAISDHALSQSLGRPTLACLATAINGDRDGYYGALEAVGRGSLDLSRFLDYFTKVIVRAQEIALAEVAFVLNKTRFHDRYDERLNERQRKAIARVFAEGRAGFAGGLSAKNYVSIAKCSPATATRDLAALRDMGALVSRGRGRGLRYEIAFPGPPFRWSDQSDTNLMDPVLGSTVRE